MSARKPLAHTENGGATPRIVERIRDAAGARKRIAFVPGNFNILHPGHLRLLNFAASCGDFFVVGVHPDGSAEALLPQDQRLESVASVGVVDFAFILPPRIEDLLAALEPAVVVKGKEHERMANPEQKVVDAYGGKLLFASGEVGFSSIDLLRREILEADLSTIRKPLDFPERHGFRAAELVEVVDRFAGLKVVVVGDVIVDEYINCDPLGMSREDPTLVVTPITQDRFMGGAGIVAAHAKGLGADVNFHCIAGNDEAGEYMRDSLDGQGVVCNLIPDDSRPTTLKQRYRADGKTLLRVSHLRQHDIGQGISNALCAAVIDDLAGADLLVFSDFNYGCVTQEVVDRLSKHCFDNDIMAVADSQALSQTGDVSRFKRMRLLTPTEYEARLAVSDYISGLVVLAGALQSKSHADQLFVTLGAEGILIHARDLHDNHFITDRGASIVWVPKRNSTCSLIRSTILSRSCGNRCWSKRRPYTTGCLWADLR